MGMGIADLTLEMGMAVEMGFCLVMGCRNEYFLDMGGRDGVKIVHGLYRWNTNWAWSV